MLTGKNISIVEVGDQDAYLEKKLTLTGRSGIVDGYGLHESPYGEGFVSGGIYIASEYFYFSQIRVVPITTVPDKIELGYN